MGEVGAEERQGLSAPWRPHCWELGGKGSEMGREEEGLVSGYPSNVIVQVTWPGGSRSAPGCLADVRLIVQGPPLGADTSVWLSPFPQCGSRNHTCVCADQLEVRQSALGGRAGQGAKKTQACQW